MLKKIFTWWNGATIGTMLFSKLNGTRMGEDALGNVYFEGGKATDGRARRWVIYAGANDASLVPPEWHGWLHYSTDLTPDQLPPPRSWRSPRCSKRWNSASSCSTTLARAEPLESRLCVINSRLKIDRFSSNSRHGLRGTPTCLPAATGWTKSRR